MLDLKKSEIQKNANRSTVPANDQINENLICNNFFKPFAFIQDLVALNMS